MTQGHQGPHPIYKEMLSQTYHLNKLFKLLITLEFIITAHQQNFITTGANY